MEADNKKMKFTINPKRFRYILDLYNLSDEEFLIKLKGESKSDAISRDELNQIFKAEKKVDLALLKKIDKLFEKGITWYISPRELPERKNISIFFRKEKFNSKLNLESRKVVNNYEELKFRIQTLCRYVNLDLEKKVREYTLSENPKDVAEEFIKKFLEIEYDLINNKIINQPKNERDYLKNLIRIIEEFNIFVFEFVDNKKLDYKKASFDGFYITPNIIVIKRQQEYFRREIFTLLHEFAHCLINQEEIDENVTESLIDLNKVERWCSSFSFNFLIGKYSSYIEQLEHAKIENDYLKNEVDYIYKNTYLSNLAIYTNLLLNKKISFEYYTNIKNNIEINIAHKVQRKREQLQFEKERKKEAGEIAFAQLPKPIESNLFKKIVLLNYFDKHINEIDLRNYLKIKPRQRLEEVIY
jgi:Zn-dependent peptidase ImmA (M78 family)